MDGQRAMLRTDCRRVEAKNEGCRCRYYVRLPEVWLGRLSYESAQCSEGVARVLTSSISVKAMHELARELRRAGAEVFFAALD